MNNHADPASVLDATPVGALRAAVRAVPAMRYAIGVGGIASIVALVLTGWKLEAQTAIIGSLVVFFAMVLLVVFAALSKTGSKTLRPLALFLAWSFLGLTVITATLFVSCAFADWPKTLPCLLGRCPEVTPPQPSDKIVISSTVRTAEKILQDLYAGNIQAVYANFSPSVQQSLPFAAFRNVVVHQMAQIPGPPLRRKLRYQPSVEGAALLVQFEAEFDSLSTWLESLTFVRFGNGWALYRIDVQPMSWLSATPSTSTVLTETTARDALAGTKKDQLVGAWIPSRGWRGTLKSSTRKAERTCDMVLAANGVTLIGRNVLGGCAQKPGTVLDLVGKVASTGKKRIELEQVRFQVADQ